VLALQNKNLTFCPGRRFKMAAARPPPAPPPLPTFSSQNIFVEKKNFLEKNFFVKKNFS